ncbi:MAG: peptide chain release factor N(5)-glutamine methyltransferase [Treponemataceae bacterium]|nr:peptide chain release factor N(5)-glutamine methyltransferase [Treponemataceae bacterium]
MTVQEAKRYGKEVLSQNTGLCRSPSIELDVSVLLQKLLNLDKTQLILNSSKNLTKEEEEIFKSQIESRNTGLPVAYITKSREFYGLDFYVDQNVLIPKADTEILVEKALELIKEKKLTKIADICTGSGCIAISIAANTENTEFYLSDISPQALKVAEKNLERLIPEKKQNFKFYQTSLMEGIQENDFDMILSNPPYIPSSMVKELLKDGRSEPVLALDGDVAYNESNNLNDGLSLIRPLAEEVYGKLKSGGIFLCETGEYNANETADYCRKLGFSVISILKDLEGQLRLVYSVKP